MVDCVFLAVFWCRERLSVGVGNKLGLGCARFVLVVDGVRGAERAGWETVVK